MALLTVTHYPVRVPEGSALRVPIRVPAGEPHRRLTGTPQGLWRPPRPLPNEWFL